MSVHADDALIASCDREPIHIPGTIQPAGFLLAKDIETAQIIAASDNISQYFPEDAASVIGKPVGALFGSEIAHDLRNRLSYSTISSRREMFATLDTPKGCCQLFVHRGKDADIIEGLIERPRRPGIHDRVASLTSALRSINSLDAIYTLATRTIRVISEYDRVMFYRFLPDESGQVVAEQRGGHMESFLGLRYPAWDIPKQARALYAKTPIRIVADVQTHDIPILFQPNQGAADLDLSMSVLRGTSVVHREYLSNMGVGSTLTVPIVVDNRLWGLVACHHETAVTPDLTVLDACELCGHVLSYAINEFVSRERLREHPEVTQSAEMFASFRSRLLQLQKVSEGLLDCWRETLGITGVGIVSDSSWAPAGRAPAAIPLDLLEAASTDAEIFSRDDISDMQCHSQDAAGALVLNVASDPTIQIVFFRPAVARSLAWGGRPDKDVREVDGELRLSPRKSFATYIEQVEHKCEAWNESDMVFARSLIERLRTALSVVGTITDQRVSLRVLADELNHRVKNILALVKSLAARSKAYADTPEQYAQSLEQRLFSLSTAHELLTLGEVTGVYLSDIFAAELSPYVTDDVLTEVLEGPRLLVRADSVSMLALLVHELTSNAAKHGALAMDDRNLHIRWRRNDGELILDWQESGLSMASEPDRRGFGMELLTKAIPYEFDAHADLDFSRSGLRARFRIPLDRIEGDADPGTGHESQDDKVAKAAPPQQEDRVLVVEDSFLLASEYEAMLQSLGFAVIDCVASVDAARKLIDRQQYRFAILDINLRGAMSFDIAEVLQRRAVKMVFVTGYDVLKQMPKSLEDIPVLRKPLDQEVLREHVRQARRS